MNNFSTRIASLVLAFGFFISCNTLTSTVNTETDQDLSQNELTERIDDINKQLSSGEQTADLLYQKGAYLIKRAQIKDNPTERTSDYREANSSLNQSVERTDNNTQSDRALELLNVSWSNEHNQGVQIMQSDSTLDRSDYQLAAAHFENATAIIPDSAVSYKMGARAYYNSQNTDRAIAMLEKARSVIPEIPSEILEQLAFLYLESDRPREATAIYEEAESFSNQNLNVIHGLSNAYINAAEHQKAIELLNQLVEEKPDNIIYKQSLATEYYYLASKKVDSVLEIQSTINSDNPQYQTADSLFRTAQQYFTALADENPNNQEIKERLAQFYHNSASKYQQLLTHGTTDDLTETIEDNITSFLTSSLPVWEDLVEKNPDQKAFWQNLHQAYSYLGMEEKARNAKSNF